MSSKKNNSSSNNDSPDKETSVTGIKKFSFYIILVFLILLPLVLLEIGLVLFNYGGNIELFVKKQTAAGLVYVLNPNVTSRYFFQKGVKTPIPITQTFTAKKDSLTFRIFCLGASTTQGFPYEVNAAFPAVLQNILSTLFPDRKVNVINCGITGLSSHSVLDLGREILKKYEPDLLIVYSGQNEFYGVFGQASRLSLFKSRRLTKLFLTLQKFRTTQLLRNVASRVRAPRVPQTSLENAETLMGLMAKDIEIRLDSPIFHQAANNFRKNITDLVKLADRENTPIMICSLVDNQRDFAPFASLHSENFSKQDSIAWQSFIRQADELFSAGEFEAAIEGYQKALALDSSYAATHYQIAHCYGKIGNDGAAQKHYRSAKDHDVVRFRAPFLFNKYLQNITRDYNVPFVDVYKEFAQTSRAGVIGNNLILEHVHPNQQGYFLIAKSIAQCMYQHKFVKPVWNWNNNKSDSVYIAMSHLTDLDREVVNYKLFTLTSHWPFPTADSTRSYQRIGNEETERMAKALVDRGEGNLVQYHLDYGDEFLKLNQFPQAEAEYLAAHAIQPFPETYNSLGRLYLHWTEIAYRDLKDFNLATSSFEKGLFYFSEGLRRWPENMSLNFNFGLLLFLRNDRTDEALAKFLKVLELKPNHKAALQQASELYVRRSQLDSAKVLLQKGVELYPEEARFYTNLGLIYLHENKPDQALRMLATAVEKGNDPKALFLLNQLREKRDKAQNPQER